MLNNLRINISSAFAIVLIFSGLVFGAGYYLYVQSGMKTDNRDVYQFKSDMLKKQLALHPGDEKIELELALEQYLEGKPDDALETYQVVLNQNPWSTPALFYTGLIRIDLKQYQQAAYILEKVVTTKPDYEPRLLYFNLGQAYYYSGNYPKALRNLKVAANIDPGAAVVHFYLGETYLKLEQYQNAKQSLEKAVQIGGTHEEVNKALDTVIRLLKKNNKKQ